MNIKIPIPPPRSAALSLCLSAALFFSGCAIFRPRAPVARPPTSPTGTVVVAGAQCAVSTGDRLGFNTIEVYIENQSTIPVTFVTALLDGEPLPRPPSHLPSNLARITIDLEGHEMILGKSDLPPDSDITWWQLYPDNTIPAGGSAVCQINLRRQPTFQRELILMDSKGAELEIRLPRFRQPRERILAATWNEDYSLMYVQYTAGGSELEGIKVNRLPVAEYEILRGGAPTVPDVAVFSPPVALNRGDPVYVELDFGGTRSRRAMVRAASGIMLSAPMLQAGPKPSPEEIGVDGDPAIECLPFDPACSDTKNDQQGGAALTMTDARTRAFREDSGVLMGVDCCAAIYQPFWNIYGQLGDALFVKTYALGWGNRTERYIEEDEEKWRSAQAGASPRPLVLIPQRFSRGGRYPTAEEMRLLAWMSLVRGGKGIRYHFWMNRGPDPFAGCEDLLPALKAINAEVAARRAELSPLILAWENNQSGVKLYQAWSGSDGILVMARNLDYTVEREPAPPGDAGPRLHVRAKEDLTLTMPAPEWFKPGRAYDFLNKTPVTVAKSGNELNLELDELDLFKLIWIENAG